MTTLLAKVDFGQAVKEGTAAFVVVAAIAVAFGVVYWLIRREMTRRETAKRDAWLEQRRERRKGEPPAP
jgi:hypothetical protein